MAGKNEKSGVKVLPPKVMPCTCKHEFQDERYGKGMRVHNYSPIKKKGYYCTVCSTPKG